MIRRAGSDVVARTRVALLALVVCLTLAGCSLPDLGAMNFRVDNRLHIEQPHDRATVRLPVHLRWSMRDFHVVKPGSAPPAKDSGYFAVFVDRQPIRPGQTMRAVANGDPSCLQSAGCPDASYLAQHQIYLASTTSLTLSQINPFFGRDAGQRLHRIVIVLLDTAGARIGESSWEVDLRITETGS